MQCHGTDYRSPQPTHSHAKFGPSTRSWAAERCLWYLKLPTTGKVENVLHVHRKEALMLPWRDRRPPSYNGEAVVFRLRWTQCWYALHESNCSYALSIADKSFQFVTIISELTQRFRCSAVCFSLQDQAYMSIYMQPLLASTPVKIFASFFLTNNNKLRCFSPQANYTDRATAACRQI
jgi:hypothetical protein